MSEPVIGTVDVAVLGSGAAGSAAAIAAARAGASTLLIEKGDSLGGTSTALFDTFYGFFAPGGSARKVVGGIADEVVDELRALGPVTTTGSDASGGGTGVTYHPEHLELVWERLVTGAGARAVLTCFAQDAAVAGGRVYAVLLATRAGLCEVRARVFIDATGDADLCHFAGFACEPAGALPPAPALTTTVRMRNVDTARCATTTTITTRLPVGEHHDRRLVGAVRSLYLSRAEMAGREQAFEYVRRLTDTVPGYEQAELARLSTQVAVSKPRRICCDYRVTREDVVSARQFEDQIGLCGVPIADDREGAGRRRQYTAGGQAVGVPFAAMLPRDAVNVILAGRCLSAADDVPASLRSMAQCMAMGQAAGEAAAMAAHQAAGATRLIDPAELRRRLVANGAILELECADARASPEAEPASNHS